MAAKIKGLQQWCQRITDGYRHVAISNFTTSWRDGMAFCAIIHRFRPDLIDYDSLSPDNVFENCKLAFEVAEKELDIPAFLEAEDMARLKVPDKLSVITYVSQYYNFLNALPQLGGPGVKGNVTSKASVGTKRHTEDNAVHAGAVKKPAKAEDAKENTKPSSSIKSPSQLSSDKCNICQNKVYLLERHIEGGKLYHRSCFRHSELSPTNKVFTRSPFMSPSLSTAEGPVSPAVKASSLKSDVHHDGANTGHVSPIKGRSGAGDATSIQGAGVKHSLAEPDREDSKKSKLQETSSKSSERDFKSKESDLPMPLSGKEARQLEKRKQEILGAEQNVKQTPAKRTVPLIFQQKDKVDESNSSSVSLAKNVLPTRNATKELPSKLSDSKSSGSTVSAGQNKSELTSKKTESKSDGAKLGLPKSIGLPSVQSLQEKFSSKSTTEQKDSTKSTPQPVARPRSGVLKPVSDGSVSSSDLVTKTTDSTPKPAPRKHVVETGQKKVAPQRPKSPPHRKTKMDEKTKSSSESSTPRSTSSQSPPPPLPTSPPPPLPTSPPPPLPSSNPIGDAKLPPKQEGKTPSSSSGISSVLKDVKLSLHPKKGDETGKKEPSGVSSNEKLNSGYLEVRLKLNHVSETPKTDTNVPSKSKPETKKDSNIDSVISHGPVKSKVLGDSSYTTTTTTKKVEKRWSTPGHTEDQPLAMFVVPQEKEEGKVLSGLLASLAGVRKRSGSTPSALEHSLSAAPITTATSTTTVSSSSSSISSSATKSSATTSSISTSGIKLSLSTSTSTSTTSTPSVLKTSTTTTPSVLKTSTTTTPSVLKTSTTTTPSVLKTSTKISTPSVSVLPSATGQSSKTQHVDQTPVAPARTKVVKSLTTTDTEKSESKTSVSGSKDESPRPEALKLLNNLKHVENTVEAGKVSKKPDVPTTVNISNSDKTDLKPAPIKGILKKDGLVSNTVSKVDEPKKETKDVQRGVIQEKSGSDIRPEKIKTESTVSSVVSKDKDLPGKIQHPAPAKTQHPVPTKRTVTTDAGKSEPASLFGDVKLKRVMPEKKDSKKTPAKAVFDVKLNKVDDKLTEPKAERPKSDDISISTSKPLKIEESAVLDKNAKMSVPASVHSDEIAKSSVSTPATSDVGKKSDSKTNIHSGEIPQWKKDIEERKKKLREDIAKSEADSVHIRHRKGHEVTKDRPKSEDLLGMRDQHKKENKTPDFKRTISSTDEKQDRPKSINIVGDHGAGDKLDWQLEAERRMAALGGFDLDSGDELKNTKENVKPKRTLPAAPSEIPQRDVSKTSALRSSQENLTKDVNKPIESLKSDVKIGEPIKLKTDTIKREQNALEGEGEGSKVTKKTEDFRDKIHSLKHIDTGEDNSELISKTKGQDGPDGKLENGLTKPHKLLNINNNSLVNDTKGHVHDEDHIAKLLQKDAPQNLSNVEKGESNNKAKEKEESTSPKLKRKITVLGRNKKGIIESPPQTPVTRKKIEVDNTFDFEKSSESSVSTEVESSLTLSTSQLTINDIRTPPPRPPPPRSKVTSPGHISAIELQQQLMDIDNRLTDLELRGRDLEDSIRNVSINEDDDDELMIEWFKLISEKNDLVRQEADLVYISREQDLEGEQEQIDSQLRYLLSLPEEAKSPEEKQEEDYLINRKLELVDQRDCIVNSMDEDRLRYIEEDRDIELMLRDKGFLVDETSASLKALKGKKVAKSKFYV